MDAPRSGAGWLTGRRGLVLGAAGLVALAATVVAVSSAAADGRPLMAASGGGSRSLSVTFGPVRTVEVAGLAGKLTVTGTAGDRAGLTGRVQWSGSAAPQVTSRFDRLTGTLKLISSCAAGSPCTADFRLAVPRRTSLVLFQLSGQVTLASAQATIRLPDSVRYAVRSEVTSGSLQDGIPQSASAARVISVRITSGELALLPG